MQYICSYNLTRRNYIFLCAQRQRNVGFLYKTPIPVLLQWNACLQNLTCKKFKTSASNKAAFGKEQKVITAVVLDLLIMLKMDQSSTWKCWSTRHSKVFSRLNATKMMSNDGLWWWKQLSSGCLKSLRCLTGDSDPHRTSSLFLTHTSWTLRFQLIFSMCSWVRNGMGTSDFCTKGLTLLMSQKFMLDREESTMCINAFKLIQFLGILIERGELSYHLGRLLMSKDKQFITWVMKYWFLHLKRLYLKTTISFITCIPGLVFGVPLALKNVQLQYLGRWCILKQQEKNLEFR